MKRLFILLFQLLIIGGCLTIYLLPTQYKREYLGTAKSGTITRQYHTRCDGHGSHYHYYFVLVDKYQRESRGELTIRTTDPNYTRWQEQQLKNYHKVYGYMKIWPVLAGLVLTLFSLIIIIQYIVFFVSDSPDKCDLSDCPLAFICLSNTKGAAAVTEEIADAKTYIIKRIMKFYNYILPKFLEFWGY